LDVCGAAYGGPRLPAEREYAPGPSALYAKNDAHDHGHSHRRSKRSDKVDIGNDRSRYRNVEADLGDLRSGAPVHIVLPGPVNAGSTL
jgi:hypothetical protein